jgi:hypothetical protein
MKRESVPQLHLGYPSNSQFSSRRASTASEMGPPPTGVHSRLSTLDKDSLVKTETLTESQEAYQNDLRYGVPPGTPIATSGQVYNTPSVVAMKGHVDGPSTPTHGHSPGNSVGWKHDGSGQSDYAVSTHGHARQLSYTLRGNEDHSLMSQNAGVARNMFETDKQLSMGYHQNQDDLHDDSPNGHNLASHPSLPSIKQDVNKDGPPSSKRRRTINQDSLPYINGMWPLDVADSGTSPSQGTADLSIPEGALASNSTVLNTSDPSSWNMSSSYPDTYGTSVLSDSNRKRPSPK